MAVGTRPGAAYVTKTLAERWDGRTWTVVATPSPSTVPHCGTCTGEIENYLSAVSCPTRTFCVAVGAYVTAPGPNEEEAGPLGTLAEVWDGHAWTVSPTITPGTYDLLYGVSCTSPRSCVAVGSTLGPIQSEALIERWDGRTWTVDPSPNVGDVNHLLAVSCATRSSCMAVGQSGNGHGPAFVEHWDGHTWTALPSADLPEPHRGGPLFDGVSCPTANSCIAVGTYFAENNFHTVSERWDGNTWTILPSPSPNTSRRSTNEFAAVSCVSATSCVAVGDTIPGAGPGQDFGFVGSWNGGAWTLVPVPSVVEYAQGISCATRRSCFAVGGVILSGTAP
jgi:hypothetical protein